MAATLPEPCHHLPRWVRTLFAGARLGAGVGLEKRPFTGVHGPGRQCCCGMCEGVKMCADAVKIPS